MLWGYRPVGHHFSCQVNGGSETCLIDSCRPFAAENWAKNSAPCNELLGAFIIFYVILYQVFCYHQFSYYIYPRSITSRLYALNIRVLLQKHIKRSLGNAVLIAYFDVFDARELDERECLLIGNLEHFCNFMRCKICRCHCRHPPHHLRLSCDELWENRTEITTPFDGLMAFSDATALWGLNESTLRKAVSYGKLRDGVDVCKFGKQWVVSMDAMRREYGNPTA